MIGCAIAIMPNLVSSTAVSNGPSELLTSLKSQTRKKNLTSRQPRPDYTKFSHTTHVTRQNLACDSCHKFPTDNWKEVRQGDAAFPDVAEFPRHDSCLNCHRQQFFARERPAPRICANCHVNVTPRNTARYLFPSLGDVTDAAKVKPEANSEFVINFSHEKHIEVVGLNRPPRKPPSFAFMAISWQEKKAAAEPSESKSCPVCHQTHQPQGDSEDEYATKPPKDLGDNFWLKKGTFKTIPNSHTGCFTCHNVDAGLAPLPSDCNACHKLRSESPALKADFDPKLAQAMNIMDQTILTAWRRRWSSGTYRHEGGEHPNIGCQKCHNVMAMNTTDPRTLRVPVSSCGGAEGCHVTATADDGGALNFEIDQKKASAGFVCTKCHVTFGKEAIPDTHVKAIQALKKS